MPEAYSLLAARALQLASQHERVLIGIAGCPGSGKSTTAAAVCNAINIAAGQHEQADKSDPAVVLPMDGFHFYRHELDAMSDPIEAHKRRGAAWTFNAQRFVAAVRSIQEAGSSGRLPSFDHAVGDPVEDDVVIEPHHRIVLVEGNYLLLDEAPWNQLRSVLKDIWFIDTPEDIAMERVFARQTAHDIGLAPEVSRQRISENDRPNARQIIATRQHATVVVPLLPLDKADDA